MNDMTKRQIAAIERGLGILAQPGQVAPLPHGSGTRRLGISIPQSDMVTAKSCGQQYFYRLGGKLFGAITEHRAQALIRVCNKPLRIDQQHAARGVFEYRPEGLIRLLRQ